MSITSNELSEETIRIIGSKVWKVYSETLENSDDSNFINIDQHLLNVNLINRSDAEKWLDKNLGNIINNGDVTDLVKTKFKKIPDDSEYIKATQNVIALIKQRAQQATQNAANTNASESLASSTTVLPSQTQQMQQQLQHPNPERKRDTSRPPAAATEQPTQQAQASQPQKVRFTSDDASPQPNAVASSPTHQSSRAETARSRSQSESSKFVGRLGNLHERTRSRTYDSTTSPMQTPLRQAQSSRTNIGSLAEQAAPQTRNESETIRIVEQSPATATQGDRQAQESNLTQQHPALTQEIIQQSLNQSTPEFRDAVTTILSSLEQTSHKNPEITYAQPNNIIINKPPVNLYESPDGSLCCTAAKNLNPNEKLAAYLETIRAASSKGNKIELDSFGDQELFKRLRASLDAEHISYDLTENAKKLSGKSKMGR